MIIGGIYSFNGGEEAANRRYPHLLTEIWEAIAAVDAGQYKVKASNEKTMRGRMLYYPPALNKAFSAEFHKRGWINRRVPSEYSDRYYVPEYNRRVRKRGAFRDMDFVKEKLGIEVQFGKYSFMVYNVAAKMTIFSNLGIIDTGVEIVPMAHLVAEMSSGVSYFEQFVWDLDQRGVSNIDVPVLILGIDTSHGQPAEIVEPPTQTDMDL